MVGFLQTRRLVRAQPYGTQVTFIQETVANGATLSAVFDVSIVVADRNQLSAGGPADALPSVGPNLDVALFSDGIGTLDIQLAIDGGGSFYSALVAPLAVPASQLLPVNMFRVSGRFVNVEFTNTSGGPVDVDFGAYMRSN